MASSAISCGIYDTTEIPIVSAAVATATAAPVPAVLHCICPPPRLRSAPTRTHSSSTGPVCLESKGVKHRTTALWLTLSA